MRTNTFIVVLAAFALLAGCRKDKPEEPEKEPVVLGNNGGVYITNEGNFGWGNATVSYYDNASGAVVDDLYEPANGGALGDVCQSMTLFNGKAYLVLNNSNSVVVVDPGTFVANATITGFVSPRYMLPVSNGKAYVTDLHGTIAVVDLANNTIAGHITCPGSTEELVLAYGKAFVTDQEGDHVYVLDTATDQVIDSIAIGTPSGSIVEDANGKLWVLSSGYMDQGLPAALHRIDPITHTVEQRFDLPSVGSPWRLTIDGTHSTLYYLNGGVYRMSITATDLPGTAFVPAAGRNFYGLGVDPASGVVYAADAVDYVQRGVVYRYASDGSALNSFPVGIIPGGFHFR